MHATNAIPLRCPLHLTVTTINSVQTLKDTTTNLHTAWSIDPTQGHAFTTLSSGFLPSEKYKIDNAQTLDLVHNGAWWVLAALAVVRGAGLVRGVMVRVHVSTLDYTSRFATNPKLSPPYGHGTTICATTLTLTLTLTTPPLIVTLP